MDYGTIFSAKSNIDSLKLIEFKDVKEVLTFSRSSKLLTLLDGISVFKS